MSGRDSSGYVWPTFVSGDRVQRPRDVYDRQSPLMVGTVVSRENDRYGAVYTVLWDGNSEPSRGYLSWGIAAHDSGESETSPTAARGPERSAEGDAS